MGGRNREAEFLISLRDLAWSFAKADLDEAGDAAAARTYPSNTAEPASTRRAGYVALLGVYVELQSYLRDSIDLAVAGVLATGGNFGDVARAQRISRQAARQRWQRAKTPATVRLTGGPREGESHRTWRDADIRIAVGDPDQWELPEEQCWLVYSASAKDPRVYEFVGYEDVAGHIAPTRAARTLPRPTSVLTSEPKPLTARRPTAERSNPGRIRVHELARELDVPSRAVLMDLKNLGIFVKSASSLIAESDAAAIRQIHKARAGRRSRQRPTEN